MKTAGIIAEYNPFHKGHAYQIQYAKEVLGADHIIVAMSGDYVQRGAPALFPKHLRAEMALRCGADLVLELPVCISTASAEIFARGAVQLLDSLGVVDMLCFGSEAGNLSGLLKLAQILAEEPGDYQRLLRESLASGNSFPAARSQALFAYCRNLSGAPAASGEAGPAFLDELSHLLSSPNNILGLEYCKALLTLHSSILPVTLKREGAGYHDPNLSPDRFASASAIRRALNRLSQTADQACTDPSAVQQLSDAAKELDMSHLYGQIPEAARSLFGNAVSQRSWITEQDFDTVLHYCLQSRSEDELVRYLDVSPALARRIANHLGGYNGFSSFCDLLKTRELTYTRIRRALLHALLGIESVPESLSCARVLGFRKSSSSLLSEIKKRSQIPLLTRAGEAASLLSPENLTAFRETVFASNLYEGILSRKTGQPFVHEYRKQVRII